MEIIERDLGVRGVGYESMVWVRDDNGTEFSCSLDSPRSGIRSLGDLTDHERTSCMDVSVIVGTERW